MSDEEWEKRVERAVEVSTYWFEKFNAANERIKLLEAVVNDSHALWANWLRRTVALPAGIGDVRQYQDRIKRLEEELNELRSDEAKLLNLNGELERRIKLILEAGDKMFPWSERVGQEFWTEAKEDKPCIKQLKTKSCIYCMKVECECSDFDVSADMGAKG